MVIEITDEESEYITDTLYLVLPAMQNLERVISLIPEQFNSVVTKTTESEGLFNKSDELRELIGEESEDEKKKLNTKLLENLNSLISYSAESDQRAKNQSRKE